MDLFADAEGLFLQIGQKLLAAVLETKDLPLQFFHPFEQGREANAEGGLEIDARALLVFDPIDFFGELAGNVVYDCEDFLIADRKSTRLNSRHGYTSYAVFCLKKNTPPRPQPCRHRPPEPWGARHTPRPSI